MMAEFSVHSPTIAAEAYAHGQRERGTAGASADDDFFLLEIFEHFIGELAQLRRALEARDLAPVGFAAPMPSTAPGDRSGAGDVDASALPAPRANEPRAETISGCLAALLQHYATHVARRFGSLGTALFEEAQLIMAALADDLFIHEVTWAGSADWRRHPIEAQLFGTSNAGNLVFDRIDALLDKRDSAKIELASINLYALRLNFQGRYRGTGQEAVLETYRQRLFAFIANRQPQLEEPDYRPFVEAYLATSDTVERRGLPHIGRWLFAISGFVILYLLVSHVIWSASIAEVTRIIDLSF